MPHGKEYIYESGRIIKGGYKRPLKTFRFSSETIFACESSLRYSLSLIFSNFKYCWFRIRLKISCELSLSWFVDTRSLAIVSKQPCILLSSDKAFPSSASACFFSNFLRSKIFSSENENCFIYFYLFNASDALARAAFAALPIARVFSATI